MQKGEGFTKKLIYYRNNSTETPPNELSGYDFESYAWVIMRDWFTKKINLLSL